MVRDPRQGGEVSRRPFHEGAGKDRRKGTRRSRKLIVRRLRYCRQGRKKTPMSFRGEAGKSVLTVVSSKILAPARNDRLAPEVARMSEAVCGRSESTKVDLA